MVGGGGYVDLAWSWRKREQGRVVQKPVNINPGLNVTHSLCFLV